MSTKSILVLGGGIGGLTAATHLAQQAGSAATVTLIDRRATFSECAHNLELLTRETAAPRGPEAPLAALAERGVRFVQADVRRIDPERRRVETSQGTFGADYLVIALGAELAPEQVPGFRDAAINLYEADGAARAGEVLADLKGGRIAVLIARTPFKCPAAPYEFALLTDSVLRHRGVREAVTVDLYTPEWQPMLAAGEQVGAEVVRLLTERSIGYHPEEMVLTVDGAARRALFETDEAEYDLLLGVPPHVAPPALRESGLTDSSGWVPVEAGTLRTRFPAVYAIGDAAAVRLHNGLFLPMAGVFAFQEGLVVAENIAAAIQGGNPTEFTGEGFCYIDVGDGKAAFGSGNFLAAPGPRVTFEPPSTEFKRAKTEFSNAISRALSSTIETPT
jgi:sulfide:quinone oxidoreductase